MSAKENQYDASQLQVLEGLAAVRKRPGMYIGSTGQRGLTHLVFEVVGRAVNEVLAGRASRVDVTLTSDGRVCVADDGAGTTTAESETAKLEAQLTRLFCGTMPVDRHEVTVGTGGVGLCVVNALSRHLAIEVRRDEGTLIQEYAKGDVLTPPRKSDTASTTGSGTTITFWPDAEIFETTEYAFEVLATRFRELAFLNRGLQISLTDQRLDSEPQSLTFLFPGGTRDFVAFLDNGHGDIIGLERDDPTMAGTLEVALGWRGSGRNQVKSFANCRSTLGGGAHERGLHDGISAALNAYAREARLLAATDPDLNPEVVAVGLTAVVSVKLDRPEFEGCTRDRLGNRPVRACVAQAVQKASASG